MSIALDAPDARTPSAMRLVLLRRKIKDRCDRSNVSSVAAFCENERKVSITMRLLHRGTKGAGESDGRSRVGSNRDCPAILLLGAISPHHATAGKERFHPIVRRADLIEDTGEEEVEELNRRVVDLSRSAVERRNGVAS